MLPHLFIRADSTQHIGTGHVMRCLSLAQGWLNKGGAVTFLSHLSDAALHCRIESIGARFIAIEKQHPNPFDLQQTQSCLNTALDSERSIPWLVLDGYHFDINFHQKIRNLGHRLLVVDDMAHLPAYEADILLNQNLHAEKCIYLCQTNPTFLLGSDYVLLRPEFLVHRGLKREIPQVASKLLVTLGGSDPVNATLNVIRALKMLTQTPLEVKVVVGPANPHMPSLVKETQTAPSIQLLHNVTNMAECMAWADLSISAGGSTCWELVFMGVPCLVLVISDNQVDIAHALHTKGIAQTLGWANTLSIAEMSKAIQTLIHSPDKRKEMVFAGQSLIDGYGQDRIIQAMTAYAQGK
jgi:UDP-2,4-diacetamido-2,4,6-trideoxy-beta-L-altropyranose hydrolase